MNRVQPVNEIFETSEVGFSSKVWGGFLEEPMRLRLVWVTVFWSLVAAGPV